MLPVVFKLTYSAISKRQGDQRKQSFLEKKIFHKRENGFTMNTQKYHITDGSCYEAVDSLISPNIFSYLNIIACNEQYVLGLPGTLIRLYLYSNRKDTFSQVAMRF